MCILKKLSKIEWTVKTVFGPDKVKLDELTRKMQGE